MDVHPTPAPGKARTREMIEGIRQASATGGPVDFHDYDDQWPVERKIAFVLRVAQPFPATQHRHPWAHNDPRFPFDAVPTRAKAAHLVRSAAMQALLMWDINVIRDPRRPGAWIRREPTDPVAARASMANHSPEAVVAWRDVWTHPSVYRQVFSDWLPSVYASRQATAPLSAAATAASKARRPPPIVPSPTGSEYRNPFRGPGGKDEPMAAYRHAAPEVYGHRTRLVRAIESPVAQDRFEAILDILANDEEGDDGDDGDPEGRVEFPHWVVRLEGIGWYLGAFLPSVLLWAHWAFRAREATPPLDTARPITIDILETVRDPVKALGADLGAVWLRLHGLLHLGGFSPRIPLPDLIRVPQELVGAVTAIAPRDPVAYKLHIMGLSGRDRRKLTRRPLTRHDLGAPEWADIFLPPVAETTDRPPTHTERAAAYRLVAQHIERLEAAHAAVLRADWMMPEGVDHRLSPPERYIPLRHPPNPHAALFLPWSVLEPARGPDTDGLFVERVASLGPLEDLVLSNVAIPCLETGLAIEEWGRCWSERQRAAPPLPSQMGVIRALGYGLPVPGWEDYPARALVLRHVHVLDPAAVTTEPLRARHEAERRARAWFRPERLLTAESLTIYGVPIDSAGRWQDSGIEMPPRLERAPTGEARPLRFLKVEHVAIPFEENRIAAMWGMFDRQRLRQTQDPTELLQPLDKAFHQRRRQRVTALVERRRWQIEAIAPWPVYFNAHWANLQPLDGAPLSAALVLRELALARSHLPYAQWLTDLLAAPGSRTTALNASVPPHRWLDAHGIGRDRGGGSYATLHPLARLTLHWLGLDRSATLSGAPARLFLPGLLPPLRPPAQQELPSLLRHYPNLALVSLHGNRLADLPPGLLDLVVSTVRTPPQRPPPDYLATRGSPSDYLATRGAVVVTDPAPLPFRYDLSANAIARVSDQALGGLLYIVKLEIAQRRSINLRINVADTPLASVLSHDPHTWRATQHILDDMKRLLPAPAMLPPDLSMAEAGGVAAMESYLLWAKRRIDSAREEASGSGGRLPVGAVLEDLVIQLEQGQLADLGILGTPPMRAIHDRFRRAQRQYAEDVAEYNRLIDRINAEWQADRALQAHPKGLAFVRKRVLAFFDVHPASEFHAQMMTFKSINKRWFI